MLFPIERRHDDGATSDWKTRHVSSGDPRMHILWICERVRLIGTWRRPWRCALPQFAEVFSWDLGIDFTRRSLLYGPIISMHVPTNALPGPRRVKKGLVTTQVLEASYGWLALSHHPHSLVVFCYTRAAELLLDRPYTVSAIGTSAGAKFDHTRDEMETSSSVKFWYVDDRRHA